jgi:CxxC-x17-CxxC domain-containing protein
MMRWLKANPQMLAYAKTGWPRLKRYRLFKASQPEDEAKQLHVAFCSECGNECEVPFKPDPHRPVYCKKCWAKRRRAKRGPQRKQKRAPRQPNRSLSNAGEQV